MIDQILPLIAIPNDTNESDVTLILSNGERIKASEGMKKYPLLKDLIVQKKLKLMADIPNASIGTPQEWPITFEGRNLVSLSFYCSKDNYQRDTSATIVFAEGQQKKFEDLLARASLPAPLLSIRDDMIKIVNDFSFGKYLLNDTENVEVKKKTFYLIAVVTILLGLVILYLLEIKKN